MRTLSWMWLAGALSFAPVACGGNVIRSSPDTDSGVTQPLSDSGGGVDSPVSPLDSGTVADGGAMADAGGGPISAPKDTWTWVPFNDALCMNGTPTGIGVNPTTRSDKLAIFLMGGGACWDSITVAIGVCSNINGYGAANAAADFTSYGTVGMFNRNDPDNPFKDYSYVFVPYCTGDVHAGDNDKAADGQMHVGYRNVAAYLKRIVPTWPHPSLLALTGASAGGLGVLVNMPQVSEAFGPSVPMIALDDAAIVMSPQYLKPSLQQATDAAWLYSKHLPADCPNLKVGALHEIYACLAQKYPKVRLGLYGTQADGTMRSFYGYGYGVGVQMPAADYQAGLDDVSANLISPFPWMHNYWAPGTSHTFLGQDPLGQTVVSGVKITDWLRGLIDGTSAFKNVHP